MGDKKNVRVNDGYQPVKSQYGYQPTKLNEGYQPTGSEQRGYQPINNSTERPEPPTTGSVVDVPKKQ